MQLLPKDVLEKIRSNANMYDFKNEFCIEDLEMLQSTGYLKAVVPQRLGGPGLTLTQLSRSQRELSKHSPATALAVNMHLLWGAVATHLDNRGDKRLEWVFEEILADEIFAFGISEAGNDSVLLDSFCVAKPVEKQEKNHVASDADSAYLISGKKIFTTLSPVWTRLGVHARTEGKTPEIVVGFLSREKFSGVRSKNEGGIGISHPDEWNTLGMRATQSWNTVLQDVPLKKSYVTAKYEPYDPNDAIIMAVSLSFGVLTASVYAGIADRALELATAAAIDDSRGSAKLEDPLLATWLTNGMLEHRSAIDSLERLATDIDQLVLREDYSVAVAAMKNQVTDEARRAVDLAMRVFGSRGFAADSELSRLYRDVLAGIFHPRSASSLAASLRDSIKK
ncbi:MAG TPA: acyl-CoA dehydrogenase family protein [Microbacteriaceae bacterium]|nr:acyl-CoA dehydrogenase family protein [Microbacteriaceae bacterium]